MSGLDDREKGRTILVFLKHPEPGRVKTRLAATVGPERAAALYRDWIGCVFSALQPMRATARLIGYHDGAPRETFRAWEPLADDWWPQPAGNLGDRLAAGFRRSFTSGSPVLALGTDCLELDAALVEQAFDLLETKDVVFGPTPDGGYYLVALAAERPGLFEGVRWSSPQTLNDHLDRCRERGWSFALLPPRHDIDTWEDYSSYLGRSANPPPQADADLVAAAHPTRSTR